MKATITIHMDNAAFEDAHEMELARILRELAKAVERGGSTLSHVKLRDTNGNTVGKMVVSE